MSNMELSFCKVYELMLRDERFYPSFKQHALYVRMLAELDMLKDPSFRGSDDGEGGKLTWGLIAITCYTSLTGVHHSIRFFFLKI